MTGYCYGEVRAAKGGIPSGGSDNSIAWLVFTAAENPVEIVAGTYRSGDSNELYTLAIVPPDFSGFGTTTISGGLQGVNVLSCTLKGGIHTATNPGDPYFNTDAKSFIGKNWIIPPWHHVVVFPNTAASSSDFPVYLLGMDLVLPGKGYKYA